MFTGLIQKTGKVHRVSRGAGLVLELAFEPRPTPLEPGVLLMEVAKYVEERGLVYPPDPGEKTATIGGNIVSNLQKTLRLRASA